MRRIGTVALGIFVVAACAWWAVAADEPDSKPPKRAKPPEWNQRSKDAFFDDARKALVGDRPTYGGKTAGGNASSGGDDEPPRADGIYAWSKLISSDTIEDEVKTLAKSVNGVVVNPQQYAGGGYKAGQDHFSMLAVLFGVIAEYDGDVRWKKNAVAAREEFAAAGFGSRVGSIQAFNQARASKDDLAGLINGQAIQSSGDGEAKSKWDKVAYRPPLMRRLKVAQEERLNGWTASASEFKRNIDKVRHEAEFVAAIAEIIGRDGFEYTDDQTYIGHCKTLKKAALDTIEATKQKNAEAARAAMSVMGKSCTTCHEAFRG